MPKTGYIQRSCRMPHSDYKAMQHIMAARELPTYDATIEHSLTFLGSAAFKAGGMHRETAPGAKCRTVSFYLRPETDAMVMAFQNQSGLFFSQIIRGCLRTAMAVDL